MRFARVLLSSALLVSLACGTDPDLDVSQDGDAIRADGGKKNDGGTGDGGGMADGGGVDADIHDDEEMATVSTNRLDFGRTVIGTSVELSFTIENRTQRPVMVSTGVITGPSANEFAIASPLQNRRLLPNESVDVTIRYDASASVAAVATLPVELCAGGYCFVDVELAGTGIADAFTCGSAPIDFGVVYPGSCLQHSVDCTNTSDHPAVMTSYSIVPSTATSFGVTGPAPTPATVGAGEAARLMLQYCPIDVSMHTAALVIAVEHPDPAHREIHIELSGAGGVQDIQCSPPAVEFGMIAVGSSLGWATNCRNVGNLFLNVTSAELAPGTSPDFTIRRPSLPLMLDELEAISIVVTFTPRTYGPYSASFIVTSDDPDTPEVVIPISGEGISPNGCVIQISATTIDFGMVQVGSATEADALVTNAGTNNCAVNVNGLSASSAATFSLVNGAQNFNIAPNSSEAVRVRFAPTAEALDAGEVELTSADVTNPGPRISLVGQGVP